MTKPDPIDQAPRPLQYESPPDSTPDYFSSQSARMTAAQFMHIFGPYSSRLDDDILPRFPAAAITAAATSGHDEPAGFLLNLEEATS